MLCRVAEEIFWMSRYVERAIAVARLIDVTWHLELDAGDRDEADAAFWTPLLGEDSGFGGADAPGRDGGLRSGAVRHYLASDERNPNSLVSCIRKARAAARGVRESISSEMWEQLNTMYLRLVDPRRAAEAEEDPHGFYRRVRDGAQFFQGLADCTLTHDETWHFLNLGKWLERADDVSRVLNLQAHLLNPAEAGGAEGEETVRWLAVLRSCGSAEAYARFYSMRVEPARVIEFLLLNPVFPQSVRYSLNAAWVCLAEIAGVPADPAATAGPAVRTLGLLRARLEHAAVDEVLEEGLREYLEAVQRQIALVSDQVTRSYLRDEPQPGRLVAVARAAQIMAAQQ